MELARLKGRIKDLLFPKFCAGCKKEGDWICEKCLPVAVVSNENKAVAHLDGVTALFDYGENTISQLIQMFKYDCLLEMSSVFEKIIESTNFANTWPGFVIIPVPLHARRQRERGFNQAEIVANLFAQKLGLKVDTNLSRAIYTVQQVKLSGEERRANLKNAFVFNGDAPKKVLLIDDVFTTGTTMQECAKVLKNNGADIVWGLVLARG